MIKIGIIGSNFGEIALLPAFKSIKKCKVVGICKGHDWKEFIENTDMDAVAIAVPPNEQFKIAKEAMAEGLHIFAEKPLTANLKQAKKLHEIAKKNKLITAIDFEFPEIAEWKKVKEILDQKTLGRLKHISVNWVWLSGDIKNRKSTWKTNTKDGGGVLSFYFCHGFNYLEHFVGPIDSMKTLLTHSPESMGGAEVGIDLSIKFKNKVTGNVHVSCASKGMVEHKLTFECEKGVIVLSTHDSVVENFTIQTYTTSNTKTITPRKQKDNNKEDPRVKIVKVLAKRFIESCESNKQMSPSFKEGVRAQELIEMARKGKI